MKTIIVVTFIGILTYAFAEEPSSNKTCCYKPMENFDSTRYLQMTPLYLTHAKYGIDSTDCQVFKFTTESNGQVNTNIYGYYKERRVLYYYEAVCNSKEESIKTGEYYADCKMVNDTYYTEPLKPFQLYMSVIDTDYQNYAALYTCYSELNYFEDNFEVFQKNPGACDDPVKETLKKRGMEL
uniref:Triabin n=1 Tax=Triatoma dimidiata TaxID=72491 RepID=D1MWF2_TRIDM|nr:hypothetical protein Td124 similar to pallidipin-like salivary lipocalin [Triatoma dimidiata]